MSSELAWFLTWLYGVGFLLTLAVYAVAWAHADPPATRHEAVMTLLLAIVWPILAVWASITLFEEMVWRTTR